MRHCRIHLVLLTLGVLLTLTLAGCGGGVRPMGSDGIKIEALRKLYLLPFGDSAGQTPRWMDLADSLYAKSFRTRFIYPAKKVQISFDDTGALQFQIVATAGALKPNFCYQMKIEGPSQAWSGGTSADFVNASLGYRGRWWNDTTGKPMTDADLTPGTHIGELIKGYLYFDFIVTNGDGSINATVPVKNSYHVTFKQGQTTYYPGQDGPLRPFTFTAVKDNWAYDNRRAVTRTVTLFGQWEPGRPLPGALSLPLGTYAGVEFRLTEESFHSTAAFGGNWRTVMNAPLPEFDVR
jgi:hypothetical protein